MKTENNTWWLQWNRTKVKNPLLLTLSYQGEGVNPSPLHESATNSGTASPRDLGPPSIFKFRSCRSLSIYDPTLQWTLEAISHWPAWDFYMQILLRVGPTKFSEGNGPCGGKAWLGSLWRDRLTKIGLILCHSHIALRLRLGLTGGWNWSWGWFVTKVEVRLRWKFRLRLRWGWVEAELKLSWIGVELRLN